MELCSSTYPSPSKPSSALDGGPDSSKDRSIVVHYGGIDSTTSGSITDRDRVSGYATATDIMHGKKHGSPTGI